jgi:hypothetical protein
MKKKKKIYFQSLKNFYFLFHSIGINYSFTKIKFCNKKKFYLFFHPDKNNKIKKKKISKKFSFWILLILIIKINLENFSLISPSFSFIFLFIYRNFNFFFLKNNYNKREKSYQKFFLKKFKTILSNLN